MKFEPTSIADVILVTPDVHRDERGFFLESFHAGKYAEGGIEGPFVQDNHSRSVRRTLRGLHAQERFPQAKLVRCTAGEIWDVAVDVRRGSPSFGRWVGVTLSAESFQQLYIPAGFAHGFCVLSDSAEVQYKVTDFYRRPDELAILWNDPELEIDWPVTDPLISKKDAASPRLREVLERLPRHGGALT